MSPLARLAVPVGLLSIVGCAPSIEDSKGVTGSVDGVGTDSGDASLEGCPAVAVNRTQLTWTGAIIGNVGEETLLIENTCLEGDPVTVAIVQEGSRQFAFSSDFDLTGITLDPGSAATVTVHYTADDYAEDFGELVVADVRGLADTLRVELIGSPADDQDLDGHAAIEAGGSDCDDSDDRVNPDATDDGIALSDLDCDGRRDEDRVQPNDLLITEVMPAPLAGTVEGGQWVEVENVSGIPIDLAGWTLVSDNGLTVDLPLDPLVLDAGGRLVLGASDDVGDNGGLEPDYAWGLGNLPLDADRDGISFQVEGRAIHRMAWGDGWPVVDGRALNLDREFVTAAAASSRAYWCVSTQLYGLGDYGSPGSANNLCAGVDHDFDGISPADGDCDDTDPTISPDAPEVWDGIDNNCDSVVDQVDESAALSTIAGAAGDALGSVDGLSFGDVDGDGSDDVIVSSPLAGGTSRTGMVYLLTGADVVAGGDAESLEFATVEGTSSYAQLGILPPQMADIDGDGTDDLFVAGSPYGTYYGGYMATLFYGGSGVAGSLDDDDGDVRISSSSTYRYYTIFPRVVVDVDVDGDGLHDVVLGDSGTYDYSGGGTTYSYYDGKAYLLSGDSLSQGEDLVLEDDSDWIASGAASQDYLGSAVGGGDLDGDGHDDLLLGARGADDGQRDGGAIYIVPGAATMSGDDTIDNLATLTITGSGNGDALGDAAPPMLADFDDDGTVDLVLAGAAEGEVYLFLDAASLSGEVDTRDADMRLEGDVADRFGESLDLGDVDGDGLLELMVGDPDAASSSYYAYADEPGGAFFFSSSVAYAGVRDASEADFQVLSTTVRGMGNAVRFWDSDGDGEDELLVTEPDSGYTSGASYGAGALYLFDPM